MADDDYQSIGESDKEDDSENSTSLYRPTQKSYFDLIYKVLNHQVRVFFKLKVEAQASTMLQKYAEDIIIDAFDSKDSDLDFIKVLECFFNTDWIIFNESQIQKMLRTFCYVIYSCTTLKEILLLKTNFYQKLLSNDRIIQKL